MRSYPLAYSNLASQSVSGSPHVVSDAGVGQARKPPLSHSSASRLAKRHDSSMLVQNSNGLSYEPFTPASVNSETMSSTFAASASFITASAVSGATGLSRASISSTVPAQTAQISRLPLSTRIVASRTIMTPTNPVTESLTHAVDEAASSVTFRGSKLQQRPQTPPKDYPKVSVFLHFCILNMKLERCCFSKSSIRARRTARPSDEYMYHVDGGAPEVIMPSLTYNHG
ncbi:unnamed protein product [Protopolystoma xenopodis]|uniref:Uncharacterized protein n=1 Tax=Protopolystoma xenopodis TaxID=117903 RepID=A0A448XEU6_9PLAT|nr:unnamed protein product [Protopolystoma xenopodis]